MNKYLIAVESNNTYCIFDTIEDISEGGARAQYKQKHGADYFRMSTLAKIDSQGKVFLLADSDVVSSERLFHIIETSLSGECIRKFVLPIGVVDEFNNHWIEQLFDAIYHQLDECEEEGKVKLLYAVKKICIDYKNKRPEWWYRKRNRVQWQQSEFDLGGF